MKGIWISPEYHGQCFVQHNVSDAVLVSFQNICAGNIAPKRDSREQAAKNGSEIRGVNSAEKYGTAVEYGNEL